MALVALTALLIFPACASRDGVGGSAPLSASGAPVAGGIYDAYNATVDTTANAAVSTAEGIITTPLTIAESFLGIDEYGQPIVNQRDRERLTPENRIQRRRSARGLPPTPEDRIKRRQEAMRTAYRRPAGF